MESVGIRELRQDASTWVRRAAAGEVIEVTDRGRPVARLGPIPEHETGLAALEAAGRIRHGRGRLSDIEPLPPDPNRPSLSEILEEMRADER